MKNILKEMQLKKHMLVILFLVLILCLGIGAGGYIYLSQHAVVTSLSQTKSSLDKQLVTLTSQLDKAKSAANVSTAGWKDYCDPYGNFCFSYPPNWSINSDHGNAAGLSGLGMGGATLVNPSKTLSVSYLDDYIKDDFPANFIVNSVTPLSPAGKDIIAVGGYYVSAGGHMPTYIVVNAGTGSNDPSTSNKPGQSISTAVVPLFEYKYGTGTALGQFVISGKKVPTTAEADAWFSSVDGKIALSVIKSFTSGSAYTGKYLNIPEVGIRIGLTYNTADAYYSINNSPTPGQPFIRLTVHSLDAYPGCSLGQDGIAIISSFTKGAADPVVGDMITAYPKAPYINGRYYFVAGAQAPCSDNLTVAQQESNAKHDFVNAYQTIQSIK